MRTLCDVQVMLNMYIPLQKLVQLYLLLVHYIIQSRHRVFSTADVTIGCTIIIKIVNSKHLYELVGQNYQEINFAS